MIATYRPIGADWPGKRTPYGQRTNSRFYRQGKFIEGEGYRPGTRVPWNETLALPPGSGELIGVELAFASPSEAAAYIIKQAGNSASMSAMFEDKSYRDGVFKRAAQRAHPDHGGSREAWDSLVEARRILDSA